MNSPLVSQGTLECSQAHKYYALSYYWTDDCNFFLMVLNLQRGSHYRSKFDNLESKMGRKSIFLNKKIKLFIIHLFNIIFCGNDLIFKSCIFDNLLVTLCKIILSRTHKMNPCLWDLLKCLQMRIKIRINMSIINLIS